MSAVASALFAALLTVEAPAAEAPQIISRVDVKVDVWNSVMSPPTFAYALGFSVAARRDFLDYFYAGGSLHLLSFWSTFEGDPNVRGDLQVAAGVCWPARRSWQFSLGVLGGVRLGYVGGTYAMRGGEFVGSVSSFGAAPSFQAAINYRQLLTRNFGLTVELQLPLHDFLSGVTDGETALLSLGVVWTFP